MIKIKEERNLLERFIVVSKSRPELDLKVCIEEFEFGVVPRSLFSLNGCLLLPYDKALILLNLQNLEKILKTSKEGEEKGERKE